MCNPLWDKGVCIGDNCSLRLFLGGVEGSACIKSGEGECRAGNFTFFFCPVVSFAFPLFARRVGVGEGGKPKRGSYMNVSTS